MQPRITVAAGILICGVVTLTGVSPDSRPASSLRLAAYQPVVRSPLEAQSLNDPWQQALSSARYGIYEQRGQVGKWYANNAAQRMRAEFTPNGVYVATQGTDGRTWRVGLTLRTVGYGARQRRVGDGRPATEGNRFQISRSGVGDASVSVSEWYVNTPSGLEQSFRLDVAPSEAAAGELLRLALAVDGNLRAHLADDGQALVFADESGRAILRYDKLVVTDANGRRLTARMELDARALWLEVEDRDAVWPITIDPTFAQQQKLLPSDPAEGHQFGFAVAISDDTVVVGAPGDVTTGDSDQGAAYVFVRSGGAWVQQQKLVASDAGAGDHFGYSVAIHGDTILVAAVDDDGPAGADQGSAYVFVRSGAVWSQQQKLVAPNAEPSDLFGHGVAIEGETLVVGALSGGPTDQGSAYVFVLSGSWVQQQELVASDPTPAGLGDHFGASVTISGETIVVGAFGDDIGQQAGQGSAYVFVRSGSVWTEQAKLLASDGAAVDNFGHSVAITGETVVVGAPGGDSVSAGIDAGAAYVFVRTGSTWTEQQKLVTADPDTHDEVGYSVAISDATIVLSADQDDSDPLSFHGSAYVFTLTSGIWTQKQKLLAADLAANDQFGFNVAVSGQTIVVGAPFDDGALVNQGSAYVFVNTPPAITAAAVSLQQGTSTPAVVVASVSDAEDAATDLTITVNSSTSATANGVTVANLIVSSTGEATATIDIACSASTASFTLRVTDTGGLFAEDTLTVTVTPSNPPIIVLNAPIGLWPPDHNYHAVTMSQMVVSATDDCDGDVTGNVVVESVTSDEQDNAGGDGNTINDILIASDCRSVQLRAERDGTQNGRVYSITLRVGDSSGNVTHAQFKVSVPHSPKNAAIEDPPAVTVLGNCP